MGSHEYVHCNSDPVGHFEDKMPQDTDEERDKMRQDPPSHNEGIFTRGACVKLRAELCDQKRWKEYAHACLRYGLCALGGEDAQFSSQSSVRDHQQDGDGGLQRPEQRLPDARGRHLARMVEEQDVSRLFGGGGGGGFKKQMVGGDVRLGFFVLSMMPKRGQDRGRCWSVSTIFPGLFLWRLDRSGDATARGPPRPPRWIISAHFLNIMGHRRRRLGATHSLTQSSDGWLRSAATYLSILSHTARVPSTLPNHFLLQGRTRNRDISKTSVTTIGPT